MFAEYAYIPLDIPKINIPLYKIKEFAYQYCEGCAWGKNVSLSTNSPNNIRYITYFIRKPIVGGKIISFSNKDFFDHKKHEGWDWDPDFIHKFPEFIDWIKYLPFDSLTEADLLTQTTSIDDHVDTYHDDTSITYFQKYKDIEPRYYRCIFSESDSSQINKNSSFFTSKEFGGKRDFIQLPEETNTFVINSSSCYHGAVKQDQFYKSTLVFNGILNKKKHLDLIEKSLKKYPGFTIKYVPASPAKGDAELTNFKGGLY